MFAKIGAFTLGGGYAMIPIIREEMIRRRWLPEAEFPDMVALSQSVPGVLAVNMAVLVGYRLRGLRGALAAVAGSVLPSFLAILAVALFFSAHRGNPWVERVFRGVRPVVVGLIAVPVVDMAVKCCRKAWQWALAAGALCAVAVFHLPVLGVMLSVLGVGCCVSLARNWPWRLRR